MSSPTRTGTAISTISRALDLAVAWNADAKNLNVIVFVIYDGAASHEQDASLPPDSQTWKAMEADDGAATVPASVLATFPINARLRIGVMRGIFESMASNGRNYTLYAITRADGAFKLMP